MTVPTLKKIFALSRQVIERATNQNLTIGTAESCTGGLIGAALTSIPGSSTPFLGGIISYSNALKSDLLSVPSDMLEKHGAVSRQVAHAMAEGAIQRLGVDIAVSVTGIAGPGGGTKAKPVGTVWMGLSKRDGSKLITETQLHNFGDIGRNKVRDVTCYEALIALHAALT